MARAASLSRASVVNRKKAGTPTRQGVHLPNLPSFNGPPPGTFDPGLEAQVRSAERGLFDLIEKTRLEGRRESHDTRQARILLERKVRQGRADIHRNRGYDVQDAGNQRQQLGINFARDIQDLAIAKQRGQQDYDRALTDMQHRYARVASEQGQTAVATGTDDSGTTAASTAVRQANQGYDQGRLDLSHGRAEEGLALQDQRTREDYALNQGHLDTALGRQLTGYGVQGHRLGLEAAAQRKQLQLGAFRNHLDRQTMLSHAKREYGIYSTDVAQQAYYQAHQLNPSIRFPIPSAAAHPANGGVGVGTGARTHVGNLRPAVAVKRRPYTRY